MGRKVGLSVSSHSLCLQRDGGQRSSGRVLFRQRLTAIDMQYDLALGRVLCPNAGRRRCN
jgi:hypothetical protein